MKPLTTQFGFRTTLASAITPLVLFTTVLQYQSGAAIAYGIDGLGNLRSITSLATMTSTVLGQTPFDYNTTMNGNVGLAMSPAGQLYAGDHVGNLWTLSMTGVAIPLGSTGVNAPITGLDWDPIHQNLLVFSGGTTPQIFHASATNGSQIGPALNVTIGGGRAESIAWLNPANALITFKDPGNSISIVQLISLSNGALVGTPDSTSILQEWTGVDVDPSNGSIHMIGWLDDSWQVANNAGALSATHIATGTHKDWTAFTMASVPEASSTSLLACGLALLTTRRKRRTR